MKHIKSALILLFSISIVALHGCEPKPNPDGIEPPPITEPEKTGFNKSYSYYFNDATLKTKLFYFLVALEENTTNQKIVTNSSLNAIKDKYDKIFNEFSWTKYADVNKLGNALLLTSEDILSVQQALESMSETVEFKNLIEKHIHPSGKYENSLELDNKYLLRVVWKESIAKGINTILEQYLIGVKPMYPLIDGPKYVLTSEEYKGLVNAQIELTKKDTDTGLFYSRLVNFVIRILEINDRNEVIRFEPLSTGENQKAIANLSAIKWADYPYSSILLLGDSPNSPGDDINISQGAKTRIQYAVEAFNAKLAPIIIVTGANVYPYQTPYFEAIEMKKWIMNNYQIDEKFIIVEPVARHTTTNLRNGSRLIFKYNIPSDKKGIIVTTKTQNDIIAADNFKQRCINELGYMPVKLGDRLNDTRLEFTPLVVSMQINSSDPLDP